MKVPLVAQAAVHSTCSRQHEHTLAGLPCLGRSSQPYHSTRTCLRRCCGIPRSIAVVEFWEQSVPHTLCTHHAAPWRCCVQVLLVMLVSAFVVWNNSASHGYHASARRSFLHFLYPANYEDYTGNPLSFPPDVFYIRNTEHFQESLEAALAGTAAMSGDALPTVRTYFNQNVSDDAGAQALVPPRFVFTMYGNVPDAVDNPAANGGTHPVAGLALQDYPVVSRIIPLLSLSSNTTQDVVRNLTAATPQLLALEYQLQAQTVNTHVSFRGNPERICVLWDVAVRFDFEVHGEAKVGLSTQYTPCVSGWPADPRNVADIVWLALAIFVTSAWLLWLTCINITRSALTFFRLRALCRIAVLASREHGAGSTTSVRRPTPAMITRPSVSRRRGSSTADLVHARLGVPLVPIVAADDHDPLLEGKDSTTNPSLALPQHAVPSTSLAKPGSSTHTSGAGQHCTTTTCGTFWTPERLRVFGDLWHSHFAPPSRGFHIMSQLVNFWNAPSIVSLVLLMCYSWSALSNAAPPTGTAPKYALGIGASLLWVTLVQYVRTNARYYVLILTLRKGLPVLAQFLLASMFLFGGYTMFAVVSFGSLTYRFSSVGQAATTLFAVMHGDVVRETYQMVLINEHHWWMRAVSQLFLYTFVFLFIYVVCMACISIMEEAFLLSRPPADGPSPAASHGVSTGDNTNPPGGGSPSEPMPVQATPAGDGAAADGRWLEYRVRPLVLRAALVELNSCREWL